jgi:hypothetical protein
MAYNIKDIFYLDTNVTITAATAGSGSAQLDLSAYTARIAMLAGAGLGDNATGAFTTSADALRADNSLVVDLQDYYGPASVPSGNAGMLTTLVEPSEDVPYVIVRDNVCLVYTMGTNMKNGSFLSVRLSCAQITLDQATLNQLLRTQTV